MSQGDIRRGVAQPIPPPPLPFCRVMFRVVMLWVDAAAGLAMVCEFPDPGGRPGPRLGVVVALLPVLVRSGSICAAARFWVCVVAWVWGWVLIGLWVWL